MIVATPITVRSCSTCLTRRVQPGRAITTLPTKRVVANANKGRLGNNRTARTNHRPLELSRTYTVQRRKATLAGDAAAAVSGSTQRNLRKGLVDVSSAVFGKPRTIPVPRWVTPKHYSITLSEMLGHGSFILVAASYAVDDFLWLRIIAVAGSTSMLFFTYFHPHGRVLWLPFKWNCLFIAINSYRVGKVYWDRYLAEQLSGELRETRSKHFFLMDPVDFAKLARAGGVETYNKGDVVVKQDHPNSYVRVVLSGGLKVMRDDKLTYTLDEGNFISESGLHAGLMLPGSMDSCCKVVAESDVRLLAWDRTELIDLLNRSPHTRRSLKAVLSWDIVRKLKKQRMLLSHGVINDAEAWTNRRHEQTEHRYTAILKNLLSLQSDEMKQRKMELNKYRTIHHIDDEHHREALKECGWTVQEFEAAHKEGYSPTEQHHDQRHGPEWYVREIIIRIVG